MISFAICDDNLPATTEIETLITNFFCTNSMAYHIDIFYDGKTLWDSFQQANGYDIIFLDIEMATDGLTTARRIRANNYDTLIIFISAYTSYWQELFEVGPFRFIEKPINAEIFHSYLSLAIKKVLSGRQVYSFHFRQKFHALPIKDILYFESRLHTIYIHTKDDVFCQHGKLDNIETIIKNGYPPFLRIHQSFLVNPQHIRSINHSETTLFNNTSLKISQNRKKQIIKEFMDIMENF